MSFEYAIVQLLDELFDAEKIAFSFFVYSKITSYKKPVTQPILYVCLTPEV